MSPSRKLIDRARNLNEPTSPASRPRKVHCPSRLSANVAREAVAWIMELQPRDRRHYGMHFVAGENFLHAAQT